MKKIQLKILGDSRMGDHPCRAPFVGKTMLHRLPAELDEGLMTEGDADEKKYRRSLAEMEKCRVDDRHSFRRVSKTQMAKMAKSLFD